MKRIISVLAENRSGVLPRTAGLFSRRGFNITSLTVGETEDPTVSRMTIVVDGDNWSIEQICKQLNKQIDVIKVKELSTEHTISRELALIKVNATPKTRSGIIEIATIMKAEIVDLTPSTLTIQICDNSEKVSQILNLLSQYGIQETVRTGIAAMQCGSEAFQAAE